MFRANIQPINAADLPPEEFRFVKAQQAIYNFCKALEQDDALKSQLKSADNPESFLEIAANNGYEFSFSDLKDALQLSLQNTAINSDEFDDYELSEEDLEMVAGGTVHGYAMRVNSYWHETGIVVDDQCFQLSYQSADMRASLAKAVKYMEKWTYKGNGEVEADDTDGINDGQTSYIFTDMIYWGSTQGRTFDFYDGTWQTVF